MFRLVIICLLILVCAEDAACKKLREENSALQSDENTSGTLIFGKLVLLPILAGVGIKFLVLLPIILSKIALLGVLSFVSSNLSLLVSAIMGVRSYFFEDKVSEEDHDYDGRHKSRFESHEPNKYAGYKDHEDNHDPNDKYMHHYKGYESSYPGYNSYQPDHDDHRVSKKRFRPFKLLGRIKDVIKDHFHKPGDHGDKYYQHNNDYKQHPHDFSADHNEYSHTTHQTRYRNSDDAIKNHKSDLKGKYYEDYKVPQDWSHKDEIVSNHIPKGEKNLDHAISVSGALPDGQLKIAVDSKAGKLIQAVYENKANFKEPFIVLGIRPQPEDSDSTAAFYATDYKITDFQTVPQADMSK